MLYTTLLSTIALGPLASALAIRAEELPRQLNSDGYDYKWTDGPNKDISIYFDKEASYVGTCTIDQIMDSVAERCVGGQCNAKPWTLKCGSTGPEHGSTVDVTLEIGTASYETWVRNGLIDTIRSALKVSGMAPEKDEIRTVWGGCSMCPSTSSYIKTREVPSSISIVHKRGNEPQSVLSFTITFEKNKNGRDMCEIISGVLLGGTMPFVKPAAGAAMGIGGIFCKAF